MRNACNHCGFPRTIAATDDQESSSAAEILDTPGEPPMASRTKARPFSTGLADSQPKVDQAKTYPRAQTCGHCRGKVFGFEGVTAMWLYEDRVRDAIIAAKYPSHSALGEVLGQRLGQQIVSRPGYERPDFVTYTPSHLHRQLARGGNGVEVIATAVSRVLGCSCISIVRLNRPVLKQAWLDNEQRQQNVRGAFRVKKSYAWFPGGRVAGRHVLLVDDVLTTGATAGELGDLLGGAGARRVSLAVVARAVRGL